MENENDEQNLNKDSKKEIQIITGDGKDLTISTVYEHIKSSNIKDEEEEKKEIVIPKGSSDNKDD